MTNLSNVSATSYNGPEAEERLCRLTGSATDRIEYELTDIIRLVGIQEPPNEKDMQAIALLIIRFFPNLKINDVKMAFLENAAGALHGKKIEPFYNSFDWNFVGAVLSSYVNTHREQKLSKPSFPVSHQIENTVPKEVEWIRNYGLLLKIIRNENRIPVEGFPWMDIWKVLTFKNRTKNIDSSLKEEIKQTVKAKLIKEATERTERMDGILRKAIMNEALDNFDYHCKKEYMIRYFSRFIKQPAVSKKGKKRK